jgi:hypothetical protein
MAPSRPNFRTSFAYRTTLLTGSGVPLRLSSSATAKLVFCTSRPPFVSLLRGDLSVDKYYRQMKTMADTVRTLGPPITDKCLVLNLLRGLSPRFDRVTPILTRMKPFPTFAETKNDLPLEELRLSATVTATPATTLYSAPRAPHSAFGGDPIHRTLVPRRLELFGRLLALGGVTVVAAAVVARVDAVARRAAEAIHRVASSGHPSTTRGLAPSRCGPGHPRAPRPLALPPLSRFSLPLHLRRCPRHLPSHSRAPSPPRASSPTRVGALDQWVGHAVSHQLLVHNDTGPTHLSL